MSHDSPYSGWLVELFRAAPRAPLTSLAVVACVGVWLGISVGEPLEQAADWERWGVYAAPVILERAWWALLTSCFVHVAGWHLAFNVYWLWALGSRIEISIGTWRYGALTLLAGALSSLGQVLAVDQGGIGYSGIGYALFGFALAAEKRWPGMREALSPLMVKLWIAWFALGFVLTHMQILSLGNAAHAVGLAIGLALGWLSANRRASGIALGVGLLAVLALALTWRPWSPHWNFVKGYSANRTGDFASAQRHYDALIRSGGDEAWARAALAHLHYIRGDLDAHRSQLERAKQLDPAKAAWVESVAKHLDYTKEWTPQMTDPLRQSLVRAALAEAEWRFADARVAYREHLQRFPAEHDNRLRLARLALADLLVSHDEIEEAVALAHEVELGDESLAPSARELRTQLERLRR